MGEFFFFFCREGVLCAAVRSPRVRVVHSARRASVGVRFGLRAACCGFLWGRAKSHFSFFLQVLFCFFSPEKKKEKSRRASRRLTRGTTPFPARLSIVLVVYHTSLTSLAC